MATIGLNLVQLTGMLDGNYNNYQDLRGEDLRLEVLSMVDTCTHALPVGGGTTRIRQNTGKIDPCLCLARVWNGGHGAQCTRKGKEGGFCSQHLKPKDCKECGVLHDYVWQHLGRVDVPIEKMVNTKARDVFLRKAGKPVCTVDSDSDTTPSPKAVVVSPSPKKTQVPKPTLSAPQEEDGELTASPVGNDGQDEITSPTLKAPTPISVPVVEQEDSDEEEESGSEDDSESEDDDEAVLPDSISMKVVGGKTHMVDDENQIWDWHSKLVIGCYDPEADTAPQY
jgi:hypothetical protein